MANLVKELVSGVLKKTRTTATKRTRRRNRKTASDGGILADIVEAAFRKPAKKQVSRRRTAASRNKLRRRAKS
ncbi:hypothetical protein BMJ22_06255 [Sinorhizobium medicae]|nr:hypothetical protein BMJ22_06255 [Sinorhizobium medicae]